MMEDWAELIRVRRNAGEPTGHMQCPNCGKTNEQGRHFCSYCGQRLIFSDSGEDADSPHASAIEEEIRLLTQRVTDLTDRVASLERIAGLPQPPPSAHVAAPAVTPSKPLRTEPATQTDSKRVVATPQPSRTVSQTPPPPPRRAAGKGFSVDWEELLGKNWFAIVGVLALTIGIGFFLRLAFQNNWIGETGRIILGIGVGAVLLVVAEFYQRRYPRWARAVAGGALGILYLSVYASFGFYQLVTPLPALLFLALVVCVGVLLSLRYESMVIALLGVIGAFITPVLLARELEPGQRYLLLIYILVVDLGIVGLSSFRNWRWFTLVGMVASYLLFGMWQSQIPEKDVLLAQGGLTGIFLLFVGATTVFHVLWRRIPGSPDLALMTLNAISYYGITYGLLWDKYEVWFGLITLGLSLFYGLVAYAAIRRPGAPPQIAIFSLATAIVFLTIAMPLQLTGSWVTVAWAAEGAVLVWVGFALRSWPTRAFALGVFAIAVLRLLPIDSSLDPEGFRLILNSRFPTFAFAIAAFYIGAYLYWKNKGLHTETEHYIHILLIGAANFLTIFILSAEVFTYFDSRELAAGLVSQAAQDAWNGTLLALTPLWAVYALGLLFVGARNRSRYLRWMAVALLTFATIKLVFFDTFRVRLDPATFTLALNFQFLSSLIVLAVLLSALLLYRRYRKHLDMEESDLPSILLIVANFVAIWILSTEAIRLFDTREIVRGTDFNNAKHLTLTVLWALYAIGIIGGGIFLRASWIRLAGIALLAVPVAKLFTFDVFLLDRGYRVIAFITLGLLLLASGLVYQRYNKAIKGFFRAKPS